jgi:hypothetical protein
MGIFNWGGENVEVKNTSESSSNEGLVITLLIIMLLLKILDFGLYCTRSFKKTVNRSNHPA